MVTEIGQAKEKYWEELSDVAGALASNFTKLVRHPGKVYGNVIDGGRLPTSEYTITVNAELSDRDDVSRLEPVDSYLAQNLLVNLAAEFPEFTGIKNWRDLTKKNISTELVGTLHMVAHRRTFWERCEVGQAWQNAGLAGTVVDGASALPSYWIDFWPARRRPT